MFVRVELPLHLYLFRPLFGDPHLIRPFFIIIANANLIVGRLDRCLPSDSNCCVCGRNISHASFSLQTDGKESTNEGLAS